jgi:geranylgeranyl transferase type-2 subunit beta
VCSFAKVMSGFVDRPNPFLLEKHAAYIKAISNDTKSFEYSASQHFRMSGVYWGLTAMTLLGKNINVEMNTSDLIVWVLRCQHSNGGCDCF